LPVRVFLPTIDQVPNLTLFIDDAPEFLDAAREVGERTVLVGIPATLD